MKKILLVVIGFHSFCIAGDLNPLLPKEANNSEKVNPNEMSTLRWLTLELSGYVWPHELGTFEWLKGVLKEVKLEEIDKKECKKFLADWYQILKKLNINGSQGAIKLVRSLEQIVKSRFPDLISNSPLFVDKVVQQVSLAMSNREEKLKTDKNAFNIAKAEVEIESSFYTEKLYELLKQIEKSEKKARFPELVEFELRESKNVQDLIELLRDKYQYVLGSRFFGTSFYEMRFLRNKETNEIIKLEKKMSEEPSVEYCIAELLRNDLFFSIATPNRFRKNSLTDNPYVANVTNNMPTDDYAKCIAHIMGKIVDFYSPIKTAYQKDAIKNLLNKANSEFENPGFDSIEPEKRKENLKHLKINLDRALARNVISIKTYKKLLAMGWHINYEIKKRDGVTYYNIKHLYRKNHQD